ncbi:MAG: hypothetical protein AAB533_01355 [Patescibacteria group bacterium]
MADLYLTIKLLPSGHPIEQDYVDLANILIQKMQTDPEIIQALMPVGRDRQEVSIQIRGFDPLIMEGYVIPGHRSVPINPIENIWGKMNRLMSRFRTAS